MTSNEKAEIVATCEKISLYSEEIKREAFKEEPNKQNMLLNSTQINYQGQCLTNILNNE